jgi:hypothetical protein
MSGRYRSATEVKVGSLLPIQQGGRMPPNRIGTLPPSPPSPATRNGGVGGEELVQ